MSRFLGQNVQKRVTFPPKKHDNFPKNAKILDLSIFFVAYRLSSQSYVDLRTFFVGVVKNKAVLDLDYELDSQAQVDLNVAMTDKGEFVELQGTAEQGTFTAEQLEQMLKLARRGIKQILEAQKKVLK